MALKLKGCVVLIEIWTEEILGYNPQISEEVPGLIPYLIESRKPCGAVIIFPGGGYKVRVAHEKECIARWINSMGLAAFILEYRVAPYRHPVPLLDAKRAVRYLRYNAEKYNIDPGRIGIIGFSAGGHLASALGTDFDYGVAEADNPVERISSRPDLMILGYPVITFGEYRNYGSMINLLGENPDEELITATSTENNVTKDTPPTFLWHTADDSVVPVQNSLIFAEELSKQNVPYSLHVFQKGPHGMALASDDPEVSKWTQLCEQWMGSIGFLK